MTTASTRTTVLNRAASCCEYCGLHQDDSPLVALHVEHIVPRKHGGTDNIANLAAACLDCNLRKGPNLTGIDPETSLVTALFNPRQDVWSDHFSWQELTIVGLTPIGRTTVRVLELNSDDRMEVRKWSGRRR